MFCIHHVRLGYSICLTLSIRVNQIYFDWWKVPPRHLQTCNIKGYSPKCFSALCSANLCEIWNDCNFAHVTSTHAVNVSAHLHLLWMDFTGCSIIHNSQHQLHERHEQQLPNSWNLFISVHAFQLNATLCSLACTNLGQLSRQ